MVKRIDLPIAEICAAYEAGESGRLIGLRYGVSRETIFKRLVDAGILLRDARARIESPEMDQAFKKAGHSGLPITHIAAEYGVSIKSLRTRLVRSGDLTPVCTWTDWSAKEKAFLSAHYKRDMSAQQIANYLGRTRNEIIGKAHRMGLSKPLNSAATMEGNQLNKASAMRA